MKKGFTLIEVLIVVLIIGILAAIALPQYRQSVDKSRFSTMIDIVQSLAQAAERYYMAQGAYTTNPRNLDVTFDDAAISGSRITFDWGYCALYTGEVGCWNITSLKNFYTHYYAFSSFGTTLRNKSACVALTGTSDDPRWQKVCTNVGGEFSNATGCSEGPCRVYIMK